MSPDDEMDSMKFADVELYARNKNIYFDGIERWWLKRICRKLVRLAARLMRRRALPVLTDRIIEYPVLFRYLEHVPKGSHLLDFGCVEDLLPMHLCALGYRVTGLDLRPYPFRHDLFDFVQADILQWQPPENRFDVAISISTVEHVGLGAYGDPIEPNGDSIAVQKLLRCIRPGGRLFLTVPAGKATTTQLMRIYDPERLNRLLPDAETVRFFAKVARHGQWREVGPEEIADLVYEDYEADSAAQGVAFIAARKT